MGERKLEYKDSKGQDCYFYYSNIAGTDLDMLGYVPVADIESEATDWSIVLLVSGMKKRESKSETFSANPFEYEFLYAPLGDKGAYAYQQPWYGFSVNKDSEEKEIAVEFLRFMMQEKEIDEMASIKGLPSVAENGTGEWYAGFRDAKSIEASFINDGSVPESIRAALGNIRLSLPAISCNGALLYDFSAESVRHRSTLNREQATTAILDILNKFPHIGVEVMAGNGEMFVIHANEVTHAHQVDEHLGSIACPVESVPDGWVKVVFASDPESIRKLGQYAKTRYYGRENYFLATNSIYLEIMPSGVSKASGLHDLCALMSKSMKNTVVIGDYYNDLEIMREAGYAVAVANAPAEVKAAADHVTTCTCAEGAVGEYLYSLIGRAEGREV